MTKSADCGCGCCRGHEHGHSHGHGMFFRHFTSKEERKEHLEQYESELKKELAGVEERIQEIENN